MKKLRIISSVLLVFICSTSWANYIHEFALSDGLKKVLIKADTIDKLFLKPTKYGFINEQGELVFDITCEYISSFHSGFAKVKQNGKYGFVDKKGTFVIDPMYVTAGDYAEGMIVVGDSTNRFDKIIDIKNTLLSTFEKPIIVSNTIKGDSLSNGFFLVTANHFKCRFSEGIITIENKFYNTTGKFLFAVDGEARDCKNGMIAYATKIPASGLLKFGYYDFNGKLMIPAKYDSAEDFSKECAVVGKKLPSQKYYEINREGKILRFVDHTSTPYYFD
jgi:hypothetical protein